MNRLWLFFMCMLTQASLFAKLGQHQLSFVFWQFDRPEKKVGSSSCASQGCATDACKEQSSKEYRVCKARALQALRELEERCDAALVALADVPLMEEEIQSVVRKYKVVGFHKQNVILQNLEWSSIVCDNPEPNSLGVSVRMRNTHNPSAACYVYCITCNKANHEKVRSVLFKRIGLPIVYLGQNLQGHPFFTSQDIDVEHSFITKEAGVSFYPKELYKYPEFFRFASKSGYDGQHSKVSSQAAMKQEPLYVIMTWPKFDRYVPAEEQHSTASKEVDVHKDSEPPLVRPKNKKPVFLPVEYPVEEPCFALCKPVCVVGKCAPVHVPTTLRRLQDDEFTVASFNFQSRQDKKHGEHECFHYRKLIAELQNISVDIICLQGIDNVNISPLLSGFVKVKRNSRCAILLNQRSSLTYSNVQDEVLLKGVSASFYDAGNPTAKIRLYCFDFDGEGIDTYVYDPQFDCDNTIIVGANLAANSVAFSKLMEKGALYTALCFGNEQICYTALYNKVATVAASIPWEGEVYDLYTGCNLLTRYGRTLQIDSDKVPLFTTFKWNGLRRYKVDSQVRS